MGCHKLLLRTAVIFDYGLVKHSTKLSNLSIQYSQTHLEVGTIITSILHKRKIRFGKQGCMFLIRNARQKYIDIMLSFVSKSPGNLLKDKKPAISSRLFSWVQTILLQGSSTLIVLRNKTFIFQRKRLLNDLKLL